jgi:hypothetical protein
VPFQRIELMTEMPGQKFPEATFDIQEREIPKLLNIFSNFLRKENLNRRIELAEKMLAGASPTYRALYVRPKQFLWLGTRDLFQFRSQERSSREFTAPMIAAAHHIASVRIALQTMPTWKKDEFRTRLMDKSGGDIPALIEIAAASRIVMLGGQIKWIPEKAPGERTPEMLVSYKGVKFEVECKAKMADSGRKIERGALYQFADRLATDEGYLKSGRQPRYLRLTMSGRFPTNLQQQMALIDVIKLLLEKGGTIELSDGSSIFVENISSEELKSRAIAERAEFEHRLANAQIVISVLSQKPDLVIFSIENDLREALRQFSGTRPGIIICYLQEIVTFDGAQKQGTATFALVQRFFSRSDAQHIVSLTFVSDPTFDLRPAEIDTGLPSLRFVSPNFSGSPLEIF